MRDNHENIKISDILKNKSYVLFMFARISTTIAFQMLTIAVGWQMYEITKSAFYLGLVGLMQFLPMFSLTLVSGFVADHYNRKVVIFISQLAVGIGILFLAFASKSNWITKDFILLIVFLIGMANSFQGPPMQAMLPNIVSKEIFPRAAALTASAFQFAVIIGPGLGGFLYYFGAEAVYLSSGLLALASSIIILFIKIIGVQGKAESKNIKSLFTGIAFIKSKPIILGAISLDLFAVLFGGATALLPVYASTILNVGPLGLGFLRSAPAVGALLMSVYLARFPLKKNVGKTMFKSVFIFGLSTLLFALSKNFALSLAALFLLGASDVISVVIRSTLVQIETPDNMRGRVSSVNLMFIGTSNQLGEFESGLTAAIFGGAVPAVILGGIGTILVVALWVKLFPELVKVDTLYPAR